jgi:DNA-binding CsgD family transcriptional regulator
VLVGRIDERARIDCLLDRARRGQSGALVLRGEPGIGKTTLLRDAAERAGEMTVLSATGISAEAELEYSGLLELLRPVIGWLEEVPEHQAAALNEALGFAAPRERDPFVVGAAVLSLLAAVAEKRPVLVAVDDAQWIDRATADALRFAARRLFADRVAFLFALRDGQESELTTAGFDEMHLGGMDLDDVNVLLARSSGAALPLDVVERVRDATSGNPLALVELGGRMTPEELTTWRFEAEPLPIASRLEQAFASRLSALPADTRAALLIVAVSTIPDFEALSRALEEAGLPSSALEPAEDRGFISIVDGRVQFRHPLVRSAVYQAASPSDRRRAHRALAASLAELDDAGMRAAHLAGAALGPDEEVAAALAAAASTARGRSGYAASAAALEKAARLTPDSELRVERLAQAVEMAWAGGDSVHALRLLDAAEPLATGATQESRLLHLRGRIERSVGLSSKARELLLRAAALVEGEDPLVAAGILRPATVAAFIGGDLPTALGLARRVRALVALDGSAVDANADFVLGWILSMCGHVDQATPSLERTVDSSLAGDRPSCFQLYLAANSLHLLERIPQSLEIAARAARAARKDGPRALLSELGTLTRCETHAGRWTLAVAHGDEALALARAVGHAQHLGALLVYLATIDAARGDVAGCRGRVDEVLRVCDEHELVELRAAAYGVLGRLELALGRAEEAAAVLGQALAAVERMGLHDRDASPQPDLIEALVQVGRREDAVTVLARYAEWARGGTPLWGRALVARCRGLLADDSSFVAHFERALELHNRVEDRFQQARTLLHFGERLRRVGRRVDARDRLRQALALFDELQATPWAERAQRELRATGERIRRAQPALGQELTPQELQVALPVSEGKTNKQAAAELFLSPKTIEFHLASVYRKLGVSSRRELIKRFSAEGPRPWCPPDVPATSRPPGRSPGTWQRRSGRRFMAVTSASVRSTDETNECHPAGGAGGDRTHDPGIMSPLL